MRIVSEKRGTARNSLRSQFNTATECAPVRGLVGELGHSAKL